MDSRDRIVLQKILQHIRSISSYCAPYHTRQEFETNPMCVEATVFNLMQIGELAKSSLSDDLKAQVTNIPWRQLYGMRNRIVHGYDGVNMQIVWDTVSEDLPLLEKELCNILSKN